MASVTLTRVNSEEKWAREVNAVIDVLNATTRGRISIYDDDGVIRDTRGATLSSSNYATTIRSGIGNHLKVSTSAGAFMFSVQNSGIGAFGTFSVLGGNVIDLYNAGSTNAVTLVHSGTNDVLKTDDGFWSLAALNVGNAISATDAGDGWMQGGLSLGTYANPAVGELKAASAALTGVVNVGSAINAVDAGDGWLQGGLSLGTYANPAVGELKAASAALTSVLNIGSAINAADAGDAWFQGGLSLGTYANPGVGELLASGNLAFKSGTAFTATLDHAATADRTVTLQDLTGTVALLGVANAGGNLLFTDNTYDIGASGATRPRNLFLAGAITATSIAVGTTPATTGAIRLANTGSLVWRNAANSADIVGLVLDGSDIFQLGASGSRLTINAPLTNTTKFVGRNAANSANIDLIGVTSANVIELGVTGTQMNLLGTVVAPSIDPPTVDGQVTNESQVKAYATVYVVGGAVFESFKYNVASVTYNGVGDYSIVINRDFLHEGYVVTWGYEDASYLLSRINYSKAATGFDLRFATTAGVAHDPDSFMFICVGTLS